MLPGALSSAGPSLIVDAVVPDVTPPRSRTPSPVSYSEMDGHERFLDMRRRQIQRSYTQASQTVKAHYRGQLEQHFDHYSVQERSVVEKRDERIEAIQKRFLRGHHEATDGKFHRAAQEAAARLEEKHALPGHGKGKQVEARTRAQKRWALVRFARLLGSLGQPKQPDAIKAKTSKPSKKWKQVKISTKLAASLKAAKDDATVTRMALENSAARKLRKRTFRGAPPDGEFEWGTRQLRLLYLIQVLSNTNNSELADGWCRRTPLCVWIYEAISAGVLTYQYYPSTEIIGGRRTALNTSAEALDDLDKLCAAGLLKAFRRSSRTYTSTTAYQVSLSGVAHIDGMLEPDRAAVHGLVVPGDMGIADSVSPRAEQLMSVSWDSGSRVFWLSHPEETSRRRSEVTCVEDVSYVSSPHVPTCLRDRSHLGGTKPTTDNRDRLSELQITKKGTAFRFGGSTMPDDTISLSGVCVLVCEWLPLSSNQMAMLNEKLGSGDTVQGGFFSDQVDHHPQQTIFNGAAEGLTVANLLDFDETTYVNYEAEVFFPTDAGVVQVEHIGVHFDDSGLATFGLRLDGVEAREGDSLNPALIARLLVDVRTDSSHVVNSVLEQRQLKTLELLHSADQNERDKYNVVIAANIKPMVDAKQYMDGKAWECELQQLLGELASAHELVERQSPSDNGLILIFGRRGVLLAGQQSMAHEPLLLAYGALRARSLVVRDMCVRIQRLNDEVSDLRAEIAVSQLDPGSLTRVRKRLRDLSTQCTALVELNTMMRNSLHSFQTPDAPNSSDDTAGALLHRVLNMSQYLQTLEARARDVRRTLESTMHTIQSLRGSVNTAANDRLLRSRKETLRRTEMCSELAKPVLGASFRGLAIVFAGLLAVRIVDALIFQDSHMTGAVSIMISSMVESLDQMCGESCSGPQRFTGPLALVAASVPYGLCWLLLAWLFLRVSRGREVLQKPTAVGRLHIDRSVDTVAVATLLQHKNVVLSEVDVALNVRPGRRVARYRWQERSSFRWRGLPPSVELTVDTAQGHLISVAVEHAPMRSDLSHRQVQEQVLVDLWQAKPPLFPKTDDVDDWVRFQALDKFIIDEVVLSLPVENQSCYAQVGKETCKPHNCLGGLCQRLL
eukprot:COSAG01_NODE_204_length_22090_cov_64.189441_14_plen_1122_part_00